MKVEFRESFLKDLRTAKNPNLLKKVKIAIESVESADIPQNIKNFKKLKGYSTYFRIKIGSYRLGLTMKGDTITFVRFLPRKEIYRFFP